jgi:predicted RecA/RadA family phage recombinase
LKLERSEITLAKNKVQEFVNIHNFPVDSGVVSGDPVMVSDLPGVAETSRDSDGNANVKHPGSLVYKLSVKAIDGSGDSAIAVGDKIYFVSGDTPKLSKKTTGVAYGYALEAVTAGSTATIEVLILD